MKKREHGFYISKTCLNESIYPRKDPSEKEALQHEAEGPVLSRASNSQEKPLSLWTPHSEALQVETPVL